MNIEISRPESMNYLSQYRRLGYQSEAQMVEAAIEMLGEKLSRFPHLSQGQLRRIAQAKEEFRQGDYLTGSQADSLVDEWLHI